MFLDIGLFDIPFGYGIRPWDVLIDQRYMNLIVKRMAQLMEKDACSIIIYCRWDHTEMVKKSMEANHFLDAEVLHVYKTNQNTAGNPTDFIHASETVVFASRNGRQQNPKLFDSKNPQMRHNLFMVPSNRDSKLKNGDNVFVNPTEKPHLSGYLFAQLFCNPGASVLVVGAGAGGDVLGLASNPKVTKIIAIEKDPIQFKELSQHLLRFHKGIHNFKDRVVEPVTKQLLHMNKLKSIVNLNQSSSEHDVEDIIKKCLHGYKARHEIMQLLPAAISKMGSKNPEGTCPSCFVKFTESTEWVICDECCVQFHTSCLTVACEFDHRFCSEECLTEHKPICDGPQQPKDDDDDDDDVNDASAAELEYTCDVMSSSNSTAENPNGYQVWPRETK